MRYTSIAEIYDANQRIAARFGETARKLSPEEATILPESEKWSISQIIEHVALVDDSMSRICRKLLRKAEEGGYASTGVTVSDEFVQKGAEFAGIKVQAPEIVEPSGTVSIAESLEKIDHAASIFAELRTKFEEFDANNLKFPHPFFGPLSAVEWLVLMGEHKRRHLKQIERRLAAQIE